MHHVRVSGALALLTALALAAPAQAKQKVDIKFTAVAGDEPVACGTPIEGLGSTAQAAQLQDLRFFVSEVKQKSFVDVNEEGTEAAAVTSVVIRETSAPAEYVIDRPFLFAIRERLSGTVLFVGKIVEIPTE